MSHVYSKKIEKDISTLEENMNQVKSNNNRMYQKRLQKLKLDCFCIMDNIDKVITSNNGTWIQK